MRLLLAIALLISTATVVTAQTPPPYVKPEGLRQITSHVHVIPDNSVPTVSNIGIIVGDKAVLVVDTGLHAKRWTREQAVKWFSETNGSSIDEVSSEVDRYCSWPGQACGYKVGHSEINRQRRRAEAAGGGHG